MGFAGNSEPQYIIPSAIAMSASTGTTTKGKRGLEDLDFYIGDDALANSKTCSMFYPIRHGQVENWDMMERYWEHCIFKYLRCAPEDHHFLLVLKF